MSHWPPNSPLPGGRSGSTTPYGPWSSPGRVSGPSAPGSTGASRFRSPPPPTWWTIRSSRIGPKANDLWKPVIAAVHGMACGGAFYLLGEAEFIVADETATFFDPHTTYGMVSAYESVYMAHRMPYGEVARMALMGTAERISARRAYDIGLVSELTAPGGALAAAVRCATVIAALSAGGCAGHRAGAVDGARGGAGPCLRAGGAAHLARQSAVGTAGGTVLGAAARTGSESVSRGWRCFAPAAPTRPVPGGSAPRPRAGELRAGELAPARPASETSRQASRGSGGAAPGYGTGRGGGGERTLTSSGPSPSPSPRPTRTRTGPCCTRTPRRP